ncbi:hypothetical protein LZ554_008962 [Drepanopeziza brunnea f. sp. 'monogermtubi']|nr:hypothetical protein LZ554_008962 [Drepanopeziza brunnea f. sp. 'monogermtubi']
MFRLRNWLTAITVTMLAPELASADWTFKSRPDLSPPTLNITLSTPSEISPGYIFVSPRPSRKVKPIRPFGPLQAGPYIFTTTGELVWSGIGSFSAATNNFQAARLNGQDVLFGFEFDATSRRTQFGQGRVKILDRKYEMVKEVAMTNHIIADKHEFQIRNEKTALFVSYTPVQCDLTDFSTSPKAQWLLDGVFQEVDIETGRLVFEWRSLDHVSPSECVVPLSTLSLGSGLNNTDAIDFFHINSVDGDGKNYLISARRTSTIYKVNGTTGDIIWRLGGKYSNFTFGPGASFGLQHDARFIYSSEGADTATISLFDNSGQRSCDGEWENESSGKTIVLDTQNWTANLVQKFAAPNGEFAFAMGNTQVLPNGNVFVNWGTEGAITEFSPSGTAVFHAYLDSEVLFRNGRPASYRGFRFNWTGTPSEDPAIVSLTNRESMTVYVSWNGDTKTKSWQFWGVDPEGREELLGDEERMGFETEFHVESGSGWKGFLAKAVGKDGKVLRTSKVAKVRPYISPCDSGKDGLAVEKNGPRAVIHEGRKSEL